LLTFLLVILILIILNIHINKVSLLAFIKQFRAFGYFEDLECT
jgi:hypothetical protein